MKVHVPCSFVYKVVCIDDKFSKPIVVFRGKNPAYEFINSYCKKAWTLQKSTEKTL